MLSSTKLMSQQNTIHFNLYNLSHCPEFYSHYIEFYSHYIELYSHHIEFSDHHIEFYSHYTEFYLLRKSTRSWHRDKYVWISLTQALIV